jgi:hypothetical protein
MNEKKMGEALKSSPKTKPHSLGILESSLACLPILFTTTSSKKGRLEAANRIIFWISLSSCV